ncbi:hypothetical protein ACFC8N_01365 [Streptomyces sp. NPDC055966]|uniref:hypothetical protein n=1 Tax=Streptomyces sp. NPDC055966 TaxID=3345669 RepID=UPI0035DBCD94
MISMPRRMTTRLPVFAAGFTPPALPMIAVTAGGRKAGPASMGRVAEDELQVLGEDRHRTAVADPDQGRGERTAAEVALLEEDRRDHRGGGDVLPGHEAREREHRRREHRQPA